MLIRFFKLYFGKILCFLYIHKWVVSSWIYDKKPDLRLRVDACKRCRKQRTKKDFTAPDELVAEKKFKLNLWQERRQVIVEKHRNPKRYKLAFRIKADKTPFISKDNVMIMDEEIEEIREKLEGRIVELDLESAVVIDIIDMDTEQPPEELL